MIKKVFILFLTVSTISLVGCANKEEQTNNDIGRDGNLTNSVNNVAVGEFKYDEELKVQVDEAETILDGILKDYDKIDINGEDVKNIVLNNNSILVDENDVNVSNTKATITNGGTYVISGNLEDGQIIVDSEEEVVLALNNANITYKTSAPIYVKQAKNAIIYLVDGSTNYLTDEENYILNEDEEPEATVFSRDDLIIAGDGTLNITANYNNAIKSKGGLTILEGTFNISSVDDGIIGKDNLLIKDAEITIDAKGDGLKASNDEEEEKGFVAIKDTTFDIIAGTDGIQAETAVIIDGGNVKVQTGGGSSLAQVESEEDISAKAIKSGTSTTIFSGIFDIDSLDDAIHSNGNIVIKSGTYNISTGDDGIHADNILSIDNGTINVCKSYEGIEAAYILINGGTVDLTSSDDGINIAGENDEEITNIDYALYISSGDIKVNALGDGIDSNGYISISGGTICVDGPTNSDNGILDYDGSLSINNANLIGVGSAGMLQASFATNSQHLVIYRENYNVNQKIEVKDSNDKVIASYVPQKSGQIILVSTPELVEAEEYSLYVDGVYVSKSSATSSAKVTNGMISFPELGKPNMGMDMTDRPMSGDFRPDKEMPEWRGEPMSGDFSSNKEMPAWPGPMSGDFRPDKEMSTWQ